MEPKINPDYAQGDLQTLGKYRNTAEAESIRNMLLEEGIPTVLKTEFIEAGWSCILLIPESGYGRAVELLNPDEDLLAHVERVRAARPSPALLLVVIVLGAAAIALYLLLAAPN